MQPRSPRTTSSATIQKSRAQGSMCCLLSLLDRGDCRLQATCCWHSSHTGERFWGRRLSPPHVPIRQIPFVALASCEVGQPWFKVQILPTYMGQKSIFFCVVYHWNWAYKLQLLIVIKATSLSDLAEDVFGAPNNFPSQYPMKVTELKKVQSWFSWEKCKLYWNQGKIGKDRKPQQICFCPSQPPPPTSYS